MEIIPKHKLNTHVSHLSLNRLQAFNLGFTITENVLVKKNNQLQVKCGLPYESPILGQLFRKFEYINEYRIPSTGPGS